MNELFQIDHIKELSLAAELFLSCSILQLTFFSISSTYLQQKQKSIILRQQIYLVGALLVWLSSILLLNEDLLTANTLSSNNSIINDYLSFTSKLTVCFTSIVFLLIVKIALKDELIQNNFEYVILILISIIGLLILCSSNDLMTAYLSIELQSVAFYIMASFKKNSCYSVESGLKYFIIGSLSSALFLFGTILTEYFFVVSYIWLDLETSIIIPFTEFSESLAAGGDWCSCEGANFRESLRPYDPTKVLVRSVEMVSVSEDKHEIIKNSKIPETPLYDKKQLFRDLLLASCCIMWVYVFLKCIQE
jgi:hypothetical protein